MTDGYTEEVLDEELDDEPEEEGEWGNDDEEYIDDVHLNIYRKNQDGSFVSIAKNIPNLGYYTILDMHPNFNKQAYRVVAVSDITGEQNFADIETEELDTGRIVIQWGEEWNLEEDYLDADAPYTTSMVDLPYNVVVAEQNAPDVTLAEYIGRDSPTAYYGTQRGQTMNLSCALAKDEDANLLEKIRRLANYAGDVYVREPSGTGYYAQINVDISQSYDSAAVDVNFAITRTDTTEPVLIATTPEVEVYEDA